MNAARLVSTTLKAVDTRKSNILLMERFLHISRAGHSGLHVYVDGQMCWSASLMSHPAVM